MMKKIFSVFAILLAIVLSCVACVKTDIPTPNALGEEINGEQLVEFYERVRATQAENGYSTVDAWYTISFEEVNHKICANEDEYKMHGTGSTDLFHPSSIADLKFRCVATTTSQQTVNGETLPGETQRGTIVGINGVAFCETTVISLLEEITPNRYTAQASMIYSSFSDFDGITLDSVVDGFSEITQKAYLNKTASVETLTIVYNYEDSDTKIEQTVILEFDAVTSDFVSFTVHACTQTVTPSEMGDDYNTLIVKFNCKTSIPLPIFEPNLESGDWASQN